MFERFKQKNADNVEMIADLDAMLVEPVAFRLHGNQHVIRPLSVEQALKLSNNFSKFQEMMTISGLTADQIVDGFFDLISAAVPTITRADIVSAEPTQLTALFGFIVRTFTGELFAEKKSLKESMTRPSMSH